MNKKITPFFTIISLTVGLIILILPQVTLAQFTEPTSCSGIIECIKEYAREFSRGSTMGLPGQDADISPVDVVAKILKYLLSFLGIVFLVLILYAGFTWMISQGDDTKVKKARKIIGASVMGIVVIVLSLAIVQFVTMILQSGTT